MTAARPVLNVRREEGDLTLSCGGDDHPESDHWKVIRLSHLTGRDHTVDQVVDLRDGQQAERVAVGEPWVRRPIEN